MSAGQDTGEYMVMEYQLRQPYPYSVLHTGERLTLVDQYRTLSGALHACRLLNAGAAIVDAHAVLGCKVVER